MRPGHKCLLQLDRLARVWLAEVFDVRLLLTLAVVALVGAILSVTAYRQQKPQTRNEASIVQAVPAGAMAERK